MLGCEKIIVIFRLIKNIIRKGYSLFMVILKYCIMYVEVWLKGCVFCLKVFYNVFFLNVKLFNFYLFFLMLWLRLFYFIDRVMGKKS